MSRKEKSRASFTVAKLSSHSDLRVSAKCVAADRDRVVASHHLTSGPIPEKKREVEHFHKEEIGGSTEYRATGARAIDRKPAGIIGQPIDA